VLLPEFFVGQGDQGGHIGIEKAAPKERLDLGEV
jgi:hypothetical protein